MILLHTHKLQSQLELLNRGLHIFIIQRTYSPFCMLLCHGHVFATNLPPLPRSCNGGRYMVDLPLVLGCMHRLVKRADATMRKRISNRALVIWIRSIMDQSRGWGMWRLLVWRHIWKRRVHRPHGRGKQTRRTRFVGRRDGGEVSLRLWRPWWAWQLLGHFQGWLSHVYLLRGGRLAAGVQRFIVN